MEQLYGKIADQYARYLIQLGQVSREELFGFEEKFWFLLNFKKVISKNPLILKTLKKIVFLIPLKSRFNIIFNWGRRFLAKFIK